MINVANTSRMTAATAPSTMPATTPPLSASDPPTSGPEAIGGGGGGTQFLITFVGGINKVVLTSG